MKEDLKAVLTEKKSQFSERVLLDIDYLVKYYIENNIAIPFYDSNFSNTVEANRETIHPTVLIANPERSSLNLEIDKKDKTESKYTLPIVTITRQGFDINKSRFPHFLKKSDQSYLTKLSHKADGTLLYQYIRRPIPITVTYTIEIITKYAQHNNHLQEQFVFHEGRYWTDDELYFLRASYSSFTESPQPADQGQERQLKSSTTLDVSGSLLPKISTDGDIRTEVNGIKKIVTNEKIVSAEEMSKLFR